MCVNEYHIPVFSDPLPRIKGKRLLSHILQYSHQSSIQRDDMFWNEVGKGFWAKDYSRHMFRSNSKQPKATHARMPAQITCHDGSGKETTRVHMEMQWYINMLYSYKLCVVAISKERRNLGHAFSSFLDQARSVHTWDGTEDVLWWQCFCGSSFGVASKKNNKHAQDTREITLRDLTKTIVTLQFNLSMLF